MRKLLVFFLLFVGMLSAHASSMDKVRISLLTCAPGSEIYALFGHSAIRYENPDQQEDWVFNYGLFSFKDPNFVMRFVKGETDYQLGVMPFAYFEAEYAMRGSSVYQQVLNLTDAEKERLIRLLKENYLPANRVYRYNYFYNNCTTKIRDQIARVAGGLSYATDTSGKVTFRDELRRLTVSHPWYSFGIDLLLGADIDKPATARELQFIPGNFKRALDKAVVVTEENGAVPFVKDQNRTVVETETPAQAVESRFTPFYVSLLLLLLTFIIMLCEVRSKKTFWLFDTVLLTLQGLCGALLLFMALFSQHPAVDNNWTILLLNPLMLLVMPVYLHKLKKHRSMSIAWVQVAFVILFFLSGAFSLQVYPAPLYFCAVALLVRSVFNIYKDRICDLSLY